MTPNGDTSWPSLVEAQLRVLRTQRKLHQWSKNDSERRFDDLFNLVCDRAALVVAWNRVKSNRGSRTAGVDGWTRWHIEHRVGVQRFLEELRSELKAHTYRRAPVREHGIPKRGGKVRYLGIPTIRDRVVQMALKLVLEPIFETDFYPASYGYRPARRAQDAIAVDEGFDFLGHRLRRISWKGKKVRFTFPSKKSLETVKRKVRDFTTRSTLNHSLKTLLVRLNPVLRGWATYFRYDASKRTLAYVDYFAWWRVFRWLRKKHPKRTTRYLRARYCGGRWSIAEAGTELFRPSKVKVERYRFRGTRILLPWMGPDELGAVGRFARSNYDDPAFLGALEEDLAASRP